MIETFAPDYYIKTIPSIFPAGTIELGEVVDWRAAIKTTLTQHSVNVHLRNPERIVWDESWEQTITNPQFNEQVTWELDGIKAADWIVLYFDLTTKSPISIFELGLVAGLGCNKRVCCTNGFWRTGNVDIVCDRYRIPQYDSIRELVTIIEQLANRGIK